MSKTREWPRGWQMPRPPGSAKFANAPPSGLTRRVNVAQLELTDALRDHLSVNTIAFGKFCEHEMKEHIKIRQPVQFQP